MLEVAMVLQAVLGNALRKINDIPSQRGPPPAG
jgi:hypothetical protein